MNPNREEIRDFYRRGVNDLNRINRLTFAAVLLIGTAIIAACLIYEEYLCSYRVKFVCKAEKNTVEKISLFHDGEQCYAFLPSYAELSGVHLEYSPGCFLYLDGQYLHPATDCSGLIVDKEYSMVIKNTLGMTVCRKTLIIKKAKNVAALHIHLTSGIVKTIHADKEVSGKDSCSLIRENRKVDYSGSIKAIHGRGNSTWEARKKPYALELPEASNLLAMGAGKKWVLLANAFDESGLKNKIALDTAKELGMKYAVDSEYVDLYIDDTYYGLYLLTEKVEVGENRVEITDLQKNTQAVNSRPLSDYAPVEDSSQKRKKWSDIPNNPEDITGGYLLQIEHHLEVLPKESSYFETDDINFVISSPKYASKKQIDYISGVCSRTEEALRNDDISGIDLNSFVDYYIMHELFDSGDPSSCFMYQDIGKTDGKLFAGPIWDFDLSFGSGAIRSGYSTQPQGLCYNRTNWFNYLYCNRNFRRLLNEKYTHVIEPRIIPFVHGKLEEYAETTESSFLMNKLRWKSVQSPNRNEFTVQIHFDSIADHVRFCEEYFDNKMTVISKEWQDRRPVCSVTFISDLSSLHFTYFPLYGMAIDENPDPINPYVEGKYRFLGWYDADGNEYTPGKAITQNQRYTARWEQTDPPPQEGLRWTARIRRHMSRQNIFIIVCLSAMGLAAAVLYVYPTGKNRRHRTG